MSFNLSSNADGTSGCGPFIDLEVMEPLLTDDDLLEVVGGAALASSTRFAASSCNLFLCTHFLLRIQITMPITVSITTTTAMITAATTPASTPSEPVYNRMLYQCMKTLEQGIP